MVNGRASLAIYIGAWVCVIACIIGIVILAVGEHPVPDELKYFGGAALGIVGGAHIAPPISKDATERVLALNERRRNG